MSEAGTVSILRRMLSAPAPAKADVPLTASRAVRLAATRAAEQGAGLLVTILGVGEETVSLDDMITGVDDNHGLIQLTRQGDGPLSQDDELVGFAALDMQFANAVLEMQTTGNLNLQTPEERRLTSADLSLSSPFLIELFKQMDECTQRTTLEGWTAGVSLGGRFANGRAIGLALADATYRVMRIGIDLGVEGRQGEVTLALPLPQTPAAVAAPEDEGTWSERLEEVVLGAPAALRAILHRFDVPLRVADGFHVGQVVPLTGCTVGSVQLEGPTGEVVAKARLGQVAGHIAVRIETPDAVTMGSLPHMAAAPVGADLMGGMGMPETPMLGMEGGMEAVGSGDMMSDGGMMDAAPMDGMGDGGMMDGAPMDGMGDGGMMDAAPMDGMGDGRMMDAAPMAMPMMTPDIESDEG